MRVELLYGLAGLLGSLVSGHLFQLYSSSLGNGTILLIVSTLLHLLCLLLAIVLLKVSVTSRRELSGLCFLALIKDRISLLVSCNNKYIDVI